jgi:capsular exopolysaccharide synthesis family protein
MPARLISSPAFTRHAALSPRSIVIRERAVRPSGPGDRIYRPRGRSLRRAPVVEVSSRRRTSRWHGLQAERGLKTLMVTSTLPEEGKTLTIANLALTLSESYKRRVLLIDADLRRPSIHEVFGLPNQSGLTEGLRAESGQLSVLEVSPHLSIVPAGHPDANPMAKLTSARMQALLEEAAASFDWVLLDAPPVGLMPDASLLARLTNAVVFVIAAGSTPYALVERAIADLGRECVIGTVLNRVDEDTILATGYYGSYYGRYDPPSTSPQ